MLNITFWQSFMFFLQIPCTDKFNNIFLAQQVLRAARELVSASENKMMSDPTDLQWLDVLNEANDKANEVKFCLITLQAFESEVKS